MIFDNTASRWPVRPKKQRRKWPWSRCDQKQAWLKRSALLLGERCLALTEANRLDLAAAPGFGLSDAQVDRLRLTPERIEDIAEALHQVALLPDPIGEVMSSSGSPQRTRGAEGPCPRWA